jgi:hypothetical protein
MQKDASEGGFKSDVREFFEGHCEIDKLRGAETTGNVKSD